MPRVLEGHLSAAGLRFAIVVSRFNSFITERLLSGALDALTRTGAGAEMIDVIKVPGSWEVPMIAGEVAHQHRYDAVICLSAVIRGETPHFDYVAAEAAKGVARSEEHTSELQSLRHLVCRLLLEKKKNSLYFMPAECMSEIEVRHIFSSESE